MKEQVRWDCGFLRTHPISSHRLIHLIISSHLIPIPHLTPLLISSYSLPSNNPASPPPHPKSSPTTEEHKPSLPTPKSPPRLILSRSQSIQAPSATTPPQPAPRPHAPHFPALPATHSRTSRTPSSTSLLVRRPVQASPLRPGPRSRIRAGDGCLSSRLVARPAGRSGAGAVHALQSPRRLERNGM